MSGDSVQPSDEVVSSAGVALKAAMKDTPEIVFAMVATVDGFDVTAHAAPGWNIDSSRLAAMASSGQALGETVANELAKTACQSVIIDADRLSIVFLSIPNIAQPPLIMGAAATKDTSLGTVIYAANRCANRIGQIETTAS